MRLCPCADQAPRLTESRALLDDGPGARWNVSRSSHRIEMCLPGAPRATEQFLCASTAEKCTDQLPRFVRKCRRLRTDQTEQNFERLIIVERGDDTVRSDHCRFRRVPTAKCF